MLKGPKRLQIAAAGNANEPCPQSPAAGTGRPHGAIARNAFHLALGQAITTTLAIVLSAALARTLGAVDFGVYFLIASFSAFAYVPVEWGQQTYIIREVARQPEGGSTLLGTALILRIAGAALVMVPSGLVAWALGYDANICWYSVAFIAVSLPFFLAQGYGMVFRARDRMGLDAGVSVANKIALLGFTLGALALGKGLPGVLVAQALAGLLALATAAHLYRRVTTGPLHYSTDIARQIMMGGTAFLFSNVLSNIQPYIDVIILSKLAPADVVGWFGAARNIMGTMIAPALIVGAASFPHLARTAANRGPFEAEIRTALRPILWLGALAVTGTILFADDAIAIVYGQRHFAPSGIILKVYAPGFLLLFMNVLFGNALFALERARACAAVKMVNVVVCTALELVLIPAFQERMGNGGIGVVAAFVASELVVFGGAIFLLRREGLKLKMFADITRALGSAVLTLLIFWLLPAPSIWVGIPLCVTVFLLCSLGLGLIRRTDVELIRALLRNEGSPPQTTLAQ